MKCYKPGTKNEIVSDHCRTKNCPDGTMCCDIGPSLRGCAPKSTTEAQCRPLFKGNWHPIENTCECKDGWTGKLCDKKPCTNTCVADHTEKQNPSPDCACVCKDGYAGDSCETRINKICPNACDHGKQKPSPDCTCVCHDGWTGKSCNKKEETDCSGVKCDGANVAFNHPSSGNCVCPYTGPLKCKDGAKPYLEPQGNGEQHGFCPCERATPCDNKGNPGFPIEESLDFWGSCQCACNNQCLNGGVGLYDAGKCGCDCAAANGRGELCEIPRKCDRATRKYCANGGIVSGDMVNGCVCDCTGTDYSGDRCTEDTRCASDMCENGGTVSGDLQNGCVCDCTGTGYSGYFCTEKDINYSCEIGGCKENPTGVFRNDPTCNGCCDKDLKCNFQNTDHIGASCECVCKQATLVDGEWTKGYTTDDCNEEIKKCYPEGTKVYNEDTNKCICNPRWKDGHLPCSELRQCLPMGTDKEIQATQADSAACACKDGYSGNMCQCLTKNTETITDDDVCVCKNNVRYTGPGCYDLDESKPDIMWCGKRKDDGSSGCFEDVNKAECAFDENDLSPCPDQYIPDGPPTAYDFNENGCKTGWNIQKCTWDEDWKNYPDYWYCGKYDCKREEQGQNSPECSFDHVQPCPSGYDISGDKYNGPDCTYGWNIQKCCNNGSIQGTNTCADDYDGPYKYCGLNGCFNSEDQAECTFFAPEINNCPDGYTYMDPPGKYSPRGCAWSWNIKKCKKDDYTPAPTLMYCGLNGCFETEQDAECSYLEHRIADCPAGYTKDGDKYSPGGCSWSWNIHRCRKNS